MSNGMKEFIIILMAVIILSMILLAGCSGGCGKFNSHYIPTERMDNNPVLGAEPVKRGAEVQCKRRGRTGDSISPTGANKGQEPTLEGK